MTPTTTTTFLSFEFDTSTRQPDAPAVEKKIQGGIGLSKGQTIASSSVLDELSLSHRRDRAPSYELRYHEFLVWYKAIDPTILLLVPQTTNHRFSVAVASERSFALEPKKHESQLRIYDGHPDKRTNQA